MHEIYIKTSLFLQIHASSSDSTININVIGISSMYDNIIKLACFDLKLITNANMSPCIICFCSLAYLLSKLILGKTVNNSLFFYREWRLSKSIIKKYVYRYTNIYNMNIIKLQLAIKIYVNLYTLRENLGTNCCDIVIRIIVNYNATRLRFHTKTNQGGSH